MKISKSWVLYAAIIAILVVSIPLEVVVAGAPSSGKQQFYFTPTVKHKKKATPKPYSSRTPTPTATFTSTPTKPASLTPTKTATSTSTVTKIPTVMSSPTTVPSIVPPPMPPPAKPYGCCPSAAIFVAGYAFFAAKNSRKKNVEL